MYGAYRHYETDKRRVGFVRQDIQSVLPSDGSFQNIVTSFMHGVDEDRLEMLGIDGGRLTAILWGVCKKQEKEIEDITSRLDAIASANAVNAAKKLLELDDLYLGITNHYLFIEIDHKHVV